MKKAQKLLSLLICTVMLMALLPLSAAANSTTITEAELLDLPTAVVGDALIPEIVVDVPSDANYSAEAYWYVWNHDGNQWDFVDSDAGTDMVKNRNLYKISVIIVPDSGYTLSAPLSVTANGTVYTAYGYESAVSFSKLFSFREIIPEVEILGWTDPAVGSAATTDGLSVPDGAPYEITSAEWIDWADNDPVDIFEEGNSYSFRLTLTAAEGYEFSEENTVLSPTGDHIYLDIYENNSKLELIADYSFLAPLSEIRIDNVPEMKVGEMARTDIQTSDDANYFAIATWSVWDDAQGFYQDFEGIFEYEKTYRLLIDVRPESGYYFSEDILFLINGAESTDTAIYGKGKYGEYTKEYSESLTVIDQVELTVEIPIPGQHTSAAPVVTLADGVTYTENSSQWMSVPEGGGSEPYDGYFSEGASYAVQTDLIAGEGTIFSEDMTVVLNGVALPQSFVTVTEKNCSVIYKFQLHTQEELTDLTEPIDLTESTDSTEPIDSTEPTDLPEPIDSTESTDSTEPTDSAEPIDSAEPTYSNSPQTGDNSNPWLWFALLIVSGAGIFGITVYDRCQRAAAGCSGDCQKEK